MQKISVRITDDDRNYLSSISNVVSNAIKAVIDDSKKHRGLVNSIPPPPPPPPPIEEIEQPPIPDDDGHEYYVHQKIKHPPKPLTPEKKKEVDRLKTLVGKFDLRKALEESDEDNKKK